MQEFSLNHSTDGDHPHWDRTDLPGTRLEGEHMKLATAFEAPWTDQAAIDPPSSLFEDPTTEDGHWAVTVFDSGLDSGELYAGGSNGVWHQPDLLAGDLSMDGAVGDDPGFLHTQPEFTSEDGW